MNEKIGILYLGKKGGGALFALQCEVEFRGKCHSFLSDMNEELPQYKDPTATSLFKIPVGIKQLIHLYSLFKLANAIIDTSKNLEITKFIFIMPHSWDLYVSKKLRKHGIKCFHIIHDYKSHPGEFFPPALYLRLLCKSAYGVLCLSDYVAARLPIKFRNKIARIDFPEYGTVALTNSEVAKTTHSILMIGRSSKYKNLNNGLSAVVTSNFTGKVTIAGEIAENGLQYENLTIISGWLTRSEIENLISESEIILLPYSSASQSGIIPIAIYFSKKIVLTNVGGLPEQVIGYLNSYISKDSTSISISKSINEALASEINKISNDLHKNKEWKSTILRIIN